MKPLTIREVAARLLASLPEYGLAALASAAVEEQHCRGLERMASARTSDYGAQLHCQEQIRRHRASVASSILALPGDPFPAAPGHDTEGA